MTNGKIKKKAPQKSKKGDKANKGFGAFINEINDAKSVRASGGEQCAISRSMPVAYRIAHKMRLKKYCFEQTHSFYCSPQNRNRNSPGENRRGLSSTTAWCCDSEICEVGDNCTIYQGVTLGGTGKDVGKRHPTLGNNVLVGAGAKVLGPLKIGDNVKIAANAVVLKEIPDNCTAAGIPARIVRRAGRKVDDLDQINIPDLVAQEIKRLEEKISALQTELEK